MADTAMNVQPISLAQIDHDPQNARRHPEAQLQALASSLRQSWGQYRPLLLRPIDNDRYVCIAGNGLLQAAREYTDLDRLDAIVLDISDEEAIALSIADNRLGDMSYFDTQTLNDLMDQLQGTDMESLMDEIELVADELTGDDDPDGGQGDSGDGGDDGDDAERAPVKIGANAIPWTTVLDARQGYWQNRKREWNQIGLNSAEGRDATPFCESGWDGLSKDIQQLRGTSSVFDPVLCEAVYQLFCPPGGTVLDPFAGGSVRGVVASAMGLQYTGVDLSERQVAANLAQYADLRGLDDIMRAKMETDVAPEDVDQDAETARIDRVAPEWLLGDSTTDLPDRKFDYVMTCPPYHDLEKYEGGDADLSMMDWDGFCAAYRTIIRQAADRLRDDRFCTIVVGEIRGQGRDRALRGLVPETIAACEAAGLRFYNDAILVTPMGTVQMACIKPFRTTRKLGRTHQYVLTFLKGDARRATAAVRGGEEITEDSA